jgi:hypothetical protein
LVRSPVVPVVPKPEGSVTPIDSFAKSRYTAAHN